jgi:atypical dual specificity phosphatase
MFPVRAIRSLPRQVWTYVRSEPVTWLTVEQVCACRYPRKAGELEALAARGVALVVNLHERAHDAARLQRCGLTELHLPVADFTCPTPAQLDEGVAAIGRTTSEGHQVAVHCGGGLGRTGTLLACYLVKRGRSPEEALAYLRAARPGSVETSQQEAAVFAYAERCRQAE